jgi:hypothetical protein
MWLLKLRVLSTADPSFDADLAPSCGVERHLRGPHPRMSQIMKKLVLPFLLIVCGWSGGGPLGLIIFGSYAAGGDGATQANCPQRQAYRIAESRHITIMF